MPSDERGIWIKIYVDELRELVQISHLTRAEIGELVMLALRINSHNRCFPSNARIAADLGRGDRVNASRIHRHLREKGALDWTQDADKRVNTYTIPLCFSFGSEVTPKSHTSDAKEPQYVANSPQGGVAKKPQGDYTKKPQGVTPKSHTEEDTEEQDSVFNKIQTEQHSGQGYALALKSPERDPTKQILLMRALLDADVDEREAYLLVQQFDPDTIKETIKASDKAAHNNKGGWIRSVIERKTGKIIEYPGQTDSTAPQRKSIRGESDEFHKQLSSAVKSARSISIYEADPYFRQFEDQEMNQT